MNNRLSIRQGSFFTGKNVERILEQCIDAKPDSNHTSEEIITVALSQDCDIVREKTQEPFIEFISGTKIPVPNGNYQNGKNPRVLDIRIGQIDYEFSIHDKFRVKKENLESLYLPAPEKLDLENLDILRKWVSKRYTRAAFPDNFNNRLGKNKAYSKLAKNNISQNVREVFIFVEEKELDEKNSYEPKILVVIPENLNKDKQEEIETAYERAFTGNGIDPDIQLVTENDVTLADLRTYKRWDMDYYSLGGAETPPAGIDII